MMKRIPKTVRIILGMIKGITSTVGMVKLFPSLMPVHDMLAIVNCAFSVMMLTAVDDEERNLFAEMIFWLVTMSLLVCPAMAFYSTSGVLKGFGYALCILFCSYVIMRVKLAVSGMEYHSEEAQMMRLVLYDQLYNRFFGGTLFPLDDGEEEPDSQDE